MFERENAFYEAHKTEFHEKYLNKWLIITGEALFGVFDTVKDAFTMAQERFEDEEFMLRRPADDDTVIEIGPIIDDGKDASGVMTIVQGDLVTYPYG
jgi:hypothetical protein